MLYKELKGLSYGNLDEYEQEYLKRFNAENCVKINFFIGDNQVFFIKSTEVYDLTIQILKKNSVAEKLCRMLPGIALKQYSRKCLIDEIVLTNKIEGVHSSRKDIGEVLNTLEEQVSEKKSGKNRFEGLVKKYIRLMNSDSITLQSCEDVKALYDEVFLSEVLKEDPNNAPDGVLFRKGAVSVQNGYGNDIHKGLLPEKKIIESMKLALSFLNDDSIEALFRVCIFHYLIEYIHPYYDGNGRLGRLILSYGISQNLCPIIAFKISEIVKENINSYYKAFKSCNNPRNLGDVTPFLIMQLTMILSSMDELIQSLTNRMNTWHYYEAIIGQMSNESLETKSLYSYLIQSSLFSENGISMDELVDNMKCSKYMVKKYMEKIPDKYIIVNKIGHYKFYNLNLEMLNA